MPLITAQDKFRIITIINSNYRILYSLSGTPELIQQIHTHCSAFNKMIPVGTIDPKLCEQLRCEMMEQLGNNQSVDLQIYLEGIYLGLMCLEENWSFAEDRIVSLCKNNLLDKIPSIGQISKIIYTNLPNSRTAPPIQAPPITPLAVDPAITSLGGITPSLFPTASAPLFTTEFFNTLNLDLSPAAFTSTQPSVVPGYATPLDPEWVKELLQWCTTVVKTGAEKGDIADAYVKLKEANDTLAQSGFYSWKSPSPSIAEMNSFVTQSAIMQRFTSLESLLNLIVVMTRRIVSATHVPLSFLLNMCENVAKDIRVSAQMRRCKEIILGSQDDERFWNLQILLFNILHNNIDNWFDIDHLFSSMGNTPASNTLATESLPIPMGATATEPSLVLAQETPSTAPEVSDSMHTETMAEEDMDIMPLEVTQASPDSQASEPREDSVTDLLHTNLSAVIIRRLNQLASQNKNEEYTPFLKRVMRYQGAFVLPLPLPDMQAIKTIINNILAEFPPESSQWPEIKAFIEEFFKRYHIVFYDTYDRNGFYDIAQDPRSNQSFKFIFHHAHDEVRTLEHVLERHTISLGDELKTKADRASPLIKRQVDEHTTNTLLFTQVELLNQHREITATPGYRLVVLFDPPTGIGRNAQQYEVKLGLAKVDESGFSSLVDIHLLKPESPEARKAQALFAKLSYDVQQYFLQEKSQRLPTHTRLTHSKEEREGLIKLIRKNNELPGTTKVVPLLAMAQARTRRHAASKRKEEAHHEVEAPVTTSRDKKKPLALALRRIYNPFAMPTATSASTATSDSDSDSDAENEEKPPKFVSFDDWCEFQEGIVLGKANKDKRGGKKPIAASLVPTQHAPTRDIPPFFAQTLADVEAKQAVARQQVFQLSSLQKEGIAKLWQQQGGLLADRVGTGKTLQAVGLARLLQQSQTQPRKVGLIVVPTTVSKQWIETLLQSGYMPEEIGVLGDTNEFKVGKHRSELLQKKIIITSYETLVSRLAKKADKDTIGLKTLCGYIHQVPSSLVIKTNKSGEIKLCVQALDRLYTEKGLYGKNKLVYERVNNQSELVKYLRRLPTDEEFTTLETLTGLKGDLLRRLLSWELIRQELQNKGIIDNASALLNMDKPLAGCLDSLYRKNPGIVIPKEAVIQFIEDRRKEFGISFLFMDEAHKLATITPAKGTSGKASKAAALPKKSYKRTIGSRLGPVAQALRSRRHQGTVVAITGTPLKHEPAQLYTLHRFLYPNLYPDTADAFTRAYKRQANGIKDGIKKLSCDPDNVHYRNVVLQLLDKTHTELSQLIDHQQHYRLHRGFTEGKLEKTPETGWLTSTYSISLRQRQFVEQNRTKIDSYCRTYETNILARKVSNDADSTSTSTTIDGEKRITEIVLKKWFSHPALADRNYTKRFFHRDKKNISAVIADYIGQCPGTTDNEKLDNFIAQSGRLKAIVDLVENILKQPPVILADGTSLPQQILIGAELIPFGHIIQYVLEKKLGVKSGLYNGTIDENTKNEVNNNFNTGVFRVLIASKAGNEGVEFNRANHVIPECGWSEADADQFIARAERRSNPHPMVYKHQLFSPDNPLERKLHAFCQHKARWQKFYLTTPKKTTLLKILFAELFKESDAALKEKIAKIQPLLQRCVKSNDMETVTTAITSETGQPSTAQASAPQAATGSEFTLLSTLRPGNEPGVKRRPMTIILGDVDEGAKSFEVKRARPGMPPNQNFR